MQEIQNINWFPGHMAKTKREIEASLKMVDAIAEIVDARLPISSRSTDLDIVVKNKPRIILLNKCDLADKKQTEKWIEFYKDQGMQALAIDCKTGKDINKFLPTLRILLKEKLEKFIKKGMIGSNLKIMIIGIPNVGKSSFINKICKSKKAKVEDRPGVTRGKQWFSIDKNFELMDTPGVLCAKIANRETAQKLAFTGAIKDDILDKEELAANLILFLAKEYPQNLIERFKLQANDLLTTEGTSAGFDLLSIIAKKRGMIKKGSIADLERVSAMVIEEFRGAKLGKITLDEI